MTAARARRPAPQGFAKGHGAENDFVVLPDPDNRLDLSNEDVVRLCERHTGLGADGILRAVRCTATPEATAMAADAQWFMDYRNADGSRGATCGNGIRLLARYLVDAGQHEPGAFAIATRAGLRHVHVPTRSHDGSGPVTVMMGRPRLPGSDSIEVAVGHRRWPALHVDMGNPHAVAFVEDLAHAGALLIAPIVTPLHAYPHGVTTEFATLRAPRHLALRVHERGVGETRACGTGACAAVAALRTREMHSTAARYTVDSPGGRLRISAHADGTMDLTGPAVVIAHGTITLPCTQA
ncbi:diaminopimelate epimerase [Streptomyces kronopolitis]|uniref:Diaminopimelate epimerase n=1 Tax=Streptomyces kronopolitis TaxID=1612435 RepID=A0ABQ2JDH7_9ACTN|nr:diaminopimelate epimerase [Streptomyces kronopolitis]GGN43104.1 diaminopimelate epimerase [Streptomyces kronopolitis]